MRTLPRLALFLFVLAFFATAMLGVTPAYAQGPEPGDKLIVGGAYTLQSGETLYGDLAVLGGTVTLETDSTVRGSVAVLGGAVEAHGLIKGDIAVIGGSLELGPTAVIEGNVATIGGSLERAEGAVIEGDIVRGIDFNSGFSPGIPLPDLPAIPGLPPRVPGPTYFILELFQAVVAATFLAILGILAVVLLPARLGRVEATVKQAPLVSFGAGALVLILAVPVILILAITICLAPLALLLLLALLPVWVMGWVALGWLAGRKLLEILKVRQQSPILEVVIGVVLLTLLWRLPTLIFCIGTFASWSFWFILSAAGVGAVLISRLGVRIYGEERSAVVAPAPALPPPPDAALPAPPNNEPPAGN